MIANSQPLRAEMIKSMLNYLMDKHDHDTSSMTPWELDFISSIGSQFERKKDLSDKQCEVLEKIYDKEQ